MKRTSAILSAFSVLLLAACASVEQPKPDPVREEITILRKQLLELQKLQMETRAKLEESADTIQALSLKVQALEQRRQAGPATLSQVASRATTTVRDGKPAAQKKVKKKVRRQE